MFLLDSPFCTAANIILKVLRNFEHSHWQPESLLLLAAEAFECLLGTT